MIIIIGCIGEKKIKMICDYLKTNFISNHAMMIIQNVTNKIKITIFIVSLPTVQCTCNLRQIFSIKLIVSCKAQLSEKLRLAWKIVCHIFFTNKCHFQNFFYFCGNFAGFFLQSFILNFWAYFPLQIDKSQQM